MVRTLYKPLSSVILQAVTAHRAKVERASSAAAAAATTTTATATATASKAPAVVSAQANKAACLFIERWLTPAIDQLGAEPSDDAAASDDAPEDDAPTADTAPAAPTTNDDDGDLIPGITDTPTTLQTRCRGIVAACCAVDTCSCYAAQMSPSCCASPRPSMCPPLTRT